MGRRKHEYEGKKEITSIRLSEEERKLILSKFKTLQDFIQSGIRTLEEGGLIMVKKNSSIKK